MTAIRTGLAAIAALTAIATGTGSALAETELTGVSCLPEGSYFSARFEKYVTEVNERGKGVVQIKYIGGAPAIGDPFTVGQRIARGVFDIGNCTGAYYQNVLPVADAWKLLERSPGEVRENGGWDLMVEYHREVGLVPIARTYFGAPFHLYLREGKAIDKPDLTGLHIRSVPIYTNFFQHLGATTQQTASTDVFPMMENGTVDGYGWPVSGLTPGWETVTKYRVDPGFYDVDFQYIVNAKVWDGLPDDARSLLETIALEHEAAAIEIDRKDVAAATEKQKELNFEVIEFTGADRDTWLQGARDAGWAGIEKVDAEKAAALRATFAKE